MRSCDESSDCQNCPWEIVGRRRPSCCSRRCDLILVVNCCAVRHFIQNWLQGCFQEWWQDCLNCWSKPSWGKCWSSELVNNLLKWLMRINNITISIYRLSMNLNINQFLIRDVVMLDLLSFHECIVDQSATYILGSRWDALWWGQWGIWNIIW